MYNNTSYFYDLFDSRWHSSMTQQPLLQVVVLCGQEAHEREAYSSWYWPRSHVTHGSSPSSEKDPGRHWAVGQRGVGWRGTFITILYIISFLFHFRRNCVMVIIMKKYSVAVLPILGGSKVFYERQVNITNIEHSFKLGLTFTVLITLGTANFRGGVGGTYDTWHLALLRLEWTSRARLALLQHHVEEGTNRTLHCGCGNWDYETKKIWRVFLW